MRLSTEDLGFFFEERHQALAAELVPIAAALSANDGHGQPAKIARALGQEHRLYRLLVPEAGPVDLRALCLVREALGQVSPLADSIFAVQGLGVTPVVLAGSAEQRQKLLPAAVRGEAIFGFGLTEPDAGSDVAGMRTTARRDGDGFVLDGEKTLISNVGIAHWFVVFANANPEAGKRGISAFLVPSDAPGLELEPIPLSVEHPIGRLRLRGCRLPASALLGDVGQGLRLALGTLDTFRVSVGAAAVGMARRAFDETLSRVRGRQQFGKPLVEQQLVQAQLAEMATELDAARLLVLRAAKLKDSGRERIPVEAAMGKLYATEAAQRIIDRAVQLHGGMGVTLGSVVERLYREIRPLRIYEGTSEIQHLIIGRALGQGGEA